MSRGGKGAFDQRRRSRRRRVWVRVLLGLVLAGLLGTGIWLVWFSSVLGVSTVRVVGAETIEPDTIREAAAIKDDTPLIRVDLTQVRTKVSALERVERADVSRSWPGTIVIRVLERTAVAWIRDNGEIRGVDRYGIDFRGYSSEPDVVEIRVTTNDPRRRQQALEALGSVVSTLRENDPELLEETAYLTADTKDSIRLVLSGKRTVTWGSADNSEEKLTVLKALLESVKASGYDVSAPDQPTTQD